MNNNTRYRYKKLGGRASKKPRRGKFAERKWPFRAKVGRPGKQQKPSVPGNER